MYPEDEMRVSKLGKSMMVRIPQAVVDTLKLKAGDEITIAIAGARRLEVARDLSRTEALARLHKHRHRLPAGFKFDRNKANARC
jgi:antitoxin MazE